jgi:hypothetical protein
MAELDPGQDRTRGWFDSAIGAASPLLDLVLALGERVSRMAEPTDYEYYPIRADERRDEQESKQNDEPEDDREDDAGPGR